MLDKLLIALFTLAIIFCHAQQVQHQHFLPDTPSAHIQDASSCALSPKGHLYISTSNGELIRFISGKSPISLNRSLNVTNAGPVAVDHHETLYVYDQSTAKIVVRHSDGTGFRFGEKGNQIGELDKVKAISVDVDGFIYILNGSRNQIDIFEPDGDYLSFISGGFDPFEDPVSIGLNAQNEIYVLDAAGPSIYIIDVFGNQVLGHKNFTTWYDVPLKNASHLAVCPNGEFFVIDNKIGQLSRFDRKGKTTMTFGGSGSSAPGVFQKSAMICLSPGSASELAVVDNGIGKVQTFHVRYPERSQPPESKRVKAEFIAESSAKKISPIKPNFRDMAVSSNGAQYLIPYENPTTLVNYANAESKEGLDMGLEFEEAIDVEIDDEGNLYVLDRGAKEVFAYDRNMGFLRKFGREIKDKLKDPSSIAIMRNGDIIVCDAGNGNIHVWSSQGIHKSKLITTHGSPLESPIAVEVDSKGQIYILDSELNCIFKTNKDGYPFVSERLKARNVKGKANSKILGFYVDQLDEIYLYNEDSHQIEMHAWDILPKFKFTIGYEGRGNNGFGNVRHFAFDEGSNRVHCIQKNIPTPKVLQFYVKPPSPKRPTVYGVENGQLVFEFDRVESRAVKGYGIIRSDLPSDSVVAETVSTKLIIDERGYAGLNLLEYKFISLSSTAISDPGKVIRNHLALGDRLLNAKHYQEAILSYVEAKNTFGDSPAVAAHMASRLASSAEYLCENLEVGLAIQLIGYALMYAPDDPFAQKVGKMAYYNYFNDFAIRDDIPSIVAEADVLRKSPDLGPVVMNAIDSLATKLASLQNERSISNAIVLSNTILDWTRNNPRYSHTLAMSHYELFKLKSQLGFPALELQLIIEDARGHASKAVLTLKQGKEPYFEENLVFLEILNASAQYSQVETHAINALTESSLQLSKQQIKDHRLQLAEAYTGMKNFKQAVQEYRQVEAIEPDNPMIQDRLGAALIAYGDLQNAKAIYRSLLVNDVTNHKYSAQLGRIELLMENYPEASFQLDKSIKLDPTDRKIYGDLAAAFRGSSNNKKALEYYLLAADYQASRIQQAENSIASLSETTFLVDQFVEYQFSIAEINDLSGAYKSSIEAYRAALAVAPENTEAHAGLAESSIKAGYVYDAVKHYGLATSLDPDNINYKRDLENALKLQDENAVNKTAISLLDLEINDLFPSMYHNYADAGVLPVGEIVLANNTESPITPSKVTVNVEGLMRRPTQIESPSLVGFSNSFVPLAAIFDGSILEISSEQTLQLEVSVEYEEGGQTKTLTKATSFKMRGRSAITWSDKRLLSCFVDPKNETLLNYCRKVNDKFSNESTHDLNDAIVKALEHYTLLNSVGYSYNPDPVQDFAYVSTHTNSLDYLAYPAETMSRKSGDCDDLVALFCALLENSGIATAYVDVPGHVFMAFDSQISADEIGSSGLSIDDVIVVKDKVWIPIETTMLGKFEFMRAWRNGARRYYKELKEGNYPEIVPLGNARQVYTPSAFVPEGFIPIINNDANIISTFQSELNALMTKVNETSIRELENRYQTEVNNVFVKNRYAMLLAKLGHLGKAEEVLLEALERSPENASVLNNMANINMRKSNYETAISFYNDATKADSSDGQVFINLCKAQLKVGDKNAASESYTEAMNLNPELKDLYPQILIQLK